MTRDYLASQIATGQVDRLIQQIWVAESERQQIEGRRNRLRGTGRDDRRALQDERRAKERQITDQHVPELWSAMLRITPNWPAWGELAAGVYLALDTVPVERPIGPDAFRRRWVDRVRREIAPGSYFREQLRSHGLAGFWDSLTNPVRDPAALRALPGPWFFLDFCFALAEPLLTRDDTAFYIVENPVRKDKVFAMPGIAASSWKGSLRWMSTKQLVDWWQGLSEAERLLPKHVRAFADRRLHLTQLFGTEKGEEDGVSGTGPYLDRAGGEQPRLAYRRELTTYLRALGLSEEHDAEGILAGSLYCFPTFFGAIDLEVINPHDRRTRAGERPVLMESVPRGARGCFRLLYAPMVLTDGSPTETRTRVASHLGLVADAVRELLTVYGFAAKKSSGFGVAHAELPQPGSLHLWSRSLPYQFDALMPVERKTTLQMRVEEARDDLLKEARG